MSIFSQPLNQNPPYQRRRNNEASKAYNDYDYDNDDDDRDDDNDSGSDGDD